ncbi:MAG: TIGR02587 family membrane protein [Elainella sp. C42_A2020_010]|nr:TIGR02587 family membrane protein [Elainella sp. C42_A2020_010]RNJ67169.1 MAG: TIGR02587 family membrane protein [Leptolyngbya sp. IPPAS B-1204]
MRRIGFPTRREWRQEIVDLIRGASGGFLFGIPLLYTMEVWWIGSYTEPPLMLIVLAVTFVIVFLLNRTDGFRQLRPDRPLQAAMDSVEALAIGIVCVTLVLILLREITLETSIQEILGKIVLEGMPFALGVALARSIMAGGEENAADGDAQPSGSSQTDANQAETGPPQAQSPPKQSFNATLADIGATLVGTIFIAFNVAPTDEVPMLTAASSPPWLLGIVAASLVISYCIVFAAGFTTQNRRLQQQGLFQKPIIETVISYLLSLVAAAMMLWLFHRLSPADPWTSWLQQTLILGLPATIGGAAGRLAI